MKLTVEEINPTRKTLIISVDEGEITRAEEGLLQEFSQQARLPGFRPGKAPIGLVRKRYQKEIGQELSRKLASEAYEFGLKESKLDVYAVVDVAGDDFKPGLPAELKVTVDIIPDFDLPEYKGVRMEVAPTSATDAEVDAAIEDMLSQRAEYNPVEREARAGDFVRCGYTGKIGDDLISEIAPDAPMFGTQATTWEEAGSPDAPGVRAVVDGLVGMKAGDTKVVTEKFPEDFHVDALKGQTAEYELKVEEVRERVLPELNEEFLETLGVESEADLREQTRASIENQKKQQNSSAQREQLNNALLAKVDFPLPESALEQQTQEILRDFMQRHLQQGVPQEEFEKRQDELLEGASRAAADRLRLRILLSRIAEEEKIEVENDDLSALIMQEAMMTRTQPDKLVKELQKDRGRVQALRENALYQKTTQFLIDAGETVEQEPTGGEASPAVEAGAETSGKE